MSTTFSASSVAVALAQQSDHEILEALSLLFSLRPDLQGHFATICNSPQAPRLVGTISAFYPEKRYGFIKCEEVTHSFGMDTFLSDQELNGYTVGSLVSFSVVTNRDGKPQARMLSEPPPGATNKAAAWVQAARKELPKPSRRPPHPPEVVPPPKAARLNSPFGEVSAMGEVASGNGSAPPTVTVDGEEKFIGTISAFYEAKHFGFIKSEGVTERFGMDAFLSDKEIGGFGVGSHVCFNVVPNKEGKPQARNLGPIDQALDTSLTDEQALLGESMPNMDHLVGFLQQPVPPPVPTVSVALPKQDPEQRASALGIADPEQRFVGTIKAFVPERHYGFLTCEECQQQFGFEAFLSDKEIGAFNNDDVVSFSVRTNRHGRPQAYDLIAAF